MSKPNVFIIESLTFDDEKNNKFEGKLLSQILHLSGKESAYYYIRTKKELNAVLEIFKKTKYRYLHISCHGSKNALSTTLDKIPFNEFGNIAGPFLKKRRLFISACKAVNENMAKNIIPSSGCYSVIGPTISPSFDQAAIFWASFYYLIFEENNNAIKREDIKPILKNIPKLFNIPIKYFSISSSDKKGYKVNKYS